MSFAKLKSGKQCVDSRQYKENVSEKVKELKLRQKNWMKERRQQLVAGESDSGLEEQRSQTAGDSRNNLSEKAALPRSRTTESRSLRTEDHTSNHPAKPPVKPAETINTRGKFQNWLKVRHDKQDDSYLQSDISSTEHSPNITCTQRGTDFGDQYETAEQLRSRLLAPEEFDNLADKIVSRARRELHSKSGTGGLGIDVSSDDQRQSSGTGGLGIDVSSDDQRQSSAAAGSENLSNKSCHHCTCCSQIMIGSQYTPMLLIPCGHTVCRQCCQGRELCPECYTRMVSATCNIMLQQIIQEYQGKLGLSSVTPPRTYRVKEQYSPQNYQEHRKVPSSTPSHHQYREQLQNLRTRLDVLATERSSVTGECDQLSDSIKKEAHQLRNITKQEDNVCSQITSLEEKLSILRLHKSEYQSRCSNLTTERDEAQKRLGMLRETMEALHNEMEKVKLLSEA